MLTGAKNEVILNFNTYKDILTEIFYPQMVQCDKILPSHTVKTSRNSTSVKNGGIENLISISQFNRLPILPSICAQNLKLAIP